MTPLVLMQDDILRNVSAATIGNDRDVFRFRADEGWDDRIAEAIDKRSRVIAFCSLNVAARLKRSHPRIAVWGDDPGLRVSRFAGVLPSHMLLNNSGIWIPFGKIRERKRQLRALYGTRFFIRPDGSGKTFSGTVIRVDDLDAEISSIRQTSAIRDDEMVFIDKAQRFRPTELRFWLSGGEVVTSAPYTHEGAPVGPGPETVREAAGLAREAARAMEPVLDMMVADFVAVSGGVKLLELNGFSTSGIYPGADVAAIVAAAREAVA